MAPSRSASACLRFLWEDWLMYCTALWYMVYASGSTFGSSWTATASTSFSFRAFATFSATELWTSKTSSRFLSQFSAQR